MKAFIDPRSAVHYGSMYILGLYELLGKKNVCFSSTYFSDLKDIDLLLAFVLIDNGGQMKKCIVDSRDQSDLIGDAYRWSDVYAKVNENDSTFPLNNPKGINIAPSFATKIWDSLPLAYHLMTNFIKGKIYKNRHHSNIHIRPKAWVRSYLRLLKRQKLSSYEADMRNRGNNYVFFSLLIGAMLKKPTKTGSNTSSVVWKIPILRSMVSSSFIRTTKTRLVSLPSGL